VEAAPSSPASCPSPASRPVPSLASRPAFQPRGSHVCFQHARALPKPFCAEHLSEVHWADVVALLCWLPGLQQAALEHILKRALQTPPCPTPGMVWEKAPREWGELPTSPASPAPCCSCQTYAGPGRQLSRTPRRCPRSARPRSVCSERTFS